MKIVNPSNLEEIEPSPPPDYEYGEDKTVKKFIFYINRVANFVFIPLDLIITLIIYLGLLYSFFMIFVISDPCYTTKATKLMEFISNNWIGSLFIVFLILFRVIITKIINLKEFKGVSFGEGQTILRVGTGDE